MKKFLFLEPFRDLFKRGLEGDVARKDFLAFIIAVTIMIIVILVFELR